VATRTQQVVIMGLIRDKVQRALAVARVYQQASVNLDPDNPDTAVTISGAQQAALVAAFDGLVAGLKADAGTL